MSSEYDSENITNENVIIINCVEDEDQLKFKYLMIQWGVSLETADFLWSCSITENVMKHMILSDIYKVFPDIKQTGEMILFRTGLIKWRMEIVSNSLF